MHGWIQHSRKSQAVCPGDGFWILLLWHRLLCSTLKNSAQPQKLCPFLNLFRSLVRQHNWVRAGQINLPVTRTSNWSELRTTDFIASPAWHRLSAQDRNTVVSEAGEMFANQFLVTGAAQIIHAVLYVLVQVRYCLLKYTDWVFLFFALNVGTMRSMFSSFNSNLKIWTNILSRSSFCRFLVDLNEKSLIRVVETTPPKMSIFFMGFCSQSQIAIELL